MGLARFRNHRAHKASVRCAMLIVLGTATSELSSGVCF